MNGSQERFGVVHINVAIDRESQKAHGFLPVHEQNHARVPAALEPGDHALPRRLEETLLENRLKRGEQKKEPKNITTCHSCSFLCAVWRPSAFDSILIAR